MGKQDRGAGEESPLISQGELDEAIEQLRTRVAGGEDDALKQLVQLVSRYELVDELRMLLATVGGLDVLTSLWNLLRKLGRRDELATFVRFGLNPDGTFAQPPKPG